MPIRFSMLLFAGIPWALWNTRNKMAIEHITSRSPLQVFHHGIIFVQKWCQLLKATDQDKMREVVERLKAWALAFASSNTIVTDIFEL